MTKRNKTEFIVVHCTDSPDSGPGSDIGTKEIRDYHTKHLGWADIGYHYVVRRNGSVELGRPAGMVGAHVRGYNDRSVGVCVVGRRDFRPDQLFSLINVVRALQQQYGVPTENVRGHYEFQTAGGKTCPNLNMDKLRSVL